MESKTRIQVLVALIGLAGAIGVAVLSNWDKIFTPVEQRGEGNTA